MCAICGIFRPDGGSIDPSRVERMRDEMVHRGPDDSGLSHGPGFALGHRRLSIIDLSSAGHQPLANEDGSVEVIFNGEIYNFSELRAVLEPAGHRFTSHTDTEVLLHGYEEWGLAGLLGRIRGMYAFALHDARKNQIHLARDPVGKKPLFFRWQNGELIFASSARALAAGIDRVPEIDPVAVDQLLWNLYIPGPRTIFRGIEKLPPGHALTIRGDGQRDNFSHWRPDFSRIEIGTGAGEWLERMEHALLGAIKRRLIADVPVGVLLSGGVDSGLVTALAARVSGRLKTFSVATEDPARDESRFAQAIASQYGTDHQVLRVSSDVRKNLVALVASMGEPLGDASAINVYSIAKLTRKMVTVAITGDGGDEAFGGYSHMRAAYEGQRLNRLTPSWGKWILPRLATLLTKRSGLLHRAGTLLRFASESIPGLVTNPDWLDRGTRLDLFTAGVYSTLENIDPAEHYSRRFDQACGNPVQKVLETDFETILPDDYLTKVDNGTMAASLEARCPFLDLEVLQVAMSLPDDLRFRNHEPKGLLRALARRHLPRMTVDRRKLGFVAPVGMWWSSGKWDDLIEEFILGPHVEARALFQRQSLKQVVEEQRRGKNRSYLLWSLLILEIWLRLTVDRSLQATDEL
jgi:asparagine synthase (glutamine-hydrolysing)